MFLFRFPLQHFRFGNGQDGAEDALEVAELVLSVTLRFQFFTSGRDWTAFIAYT